MKSCLLSFTAAECFPFFSAAAFFAAAPAAASWVTIVTSTEMGSPGRKAVMSGFFAGRRQSNSTIHRRCGSGHQRRRALPTQSSEEEPVTRRAIASTHHHCKQVDESHSATYRFRGSRGSNPIEVRSAHFRAAILRRIQVAGSTIGEKLNGCRLSEEYLTPPPPVNLTTVPSVLRRRSTLGPTTHVVVADLRHWLHQLQMNPETRALKSTIPSQSLERYSDGARCQ
jgi:hypothetical protein